MKAGKLGIFSAFLASVCCLGPVVLILLGLGSLGLGAVLGRYHWFLLLAAAGILAYAWRAYRKERRQCEAAHCRMAQGPVTKWTLIVASVFVAGFLGLNLATYASQQYPQWSSTQSAKGPLAQVMLPVEGMTCFTCELAVESGLKKLPGVVDSDARVREKTAHVRYDPSRVKVEDLIEAINRTGYKASRPAVEEN